VDTGQEVDEMVIIIYLLIGLFIASIEENGDDQIKRVLWAWLLIFIWLPILVVRIIYNERLIKW